MKFRMCPVFLSGLLAMLAALTASAQDRLKHMPGYERFQRMNRERGDAVNRGTLSVTWKEEGKALEYSKGGKRFRYEIAERIAIELPRESGEASSATSEKKPSRKKDTPRPARGRQYSSAVSPDGMHKAFYRQRNLWLSDADGEHEYAVTADGGDTSRVKYGSATWTYGEELDQNTAMWWSSNSQRVAFYRFDESGVPDYYLALSQTAIQSQLDVEPYPKAGSVNPMVDLLIYDLTSRQTVRVDVRDGKEFDNSVVGHYVYGVSWTPDGRELLFHRTNRRQNIMELCAADPGSGKCRVIVREEWPASWTENSPTMQFLKDGRRFIWSSERTGWKNYYLYDLGCNLLATLTRHSFEVADIVRVDEERKVLYYMARSGDNPMKLQLHRVGLDGLGDMRLTDPTFHHSVDIAPDGRHFIDIAQTHDIPPTTRLMDADGRCVDVLARSDLTKFNKLGLKPVELLQFKAADTQTDLYGLLHFPSDFRPNKRYPLLVGVYAGPATVGARETFTLPDPLTEYGFLVATFDSRSASGRGKRFLDAIYEKLGLVEIDDQAAGVKALWNRRYVDRERVGIYGTSYGGTASALCLMRYPDVFQAACSSSPVTDFRNYDTVYTERYLWLPQENPRVYDAVRLMTYVERLRGRLMLFYGTADDNVHPANMMQFIQALQKAGKSFDVQVGPDHGHSSLNQDRMMEFFIENLVLKK